MKTNKWCSSCGYKAMNYNPKGWKCTQCGAKNFSWKLSDILKKILHPNNNYRCPECGILLVGNIIARGFGWHKSEFRCKCGFNKNIRWASYP